MKRLEMVIFAVFMILVFVFVGIKYSSANTRLNRNSFVRFHFIDKNNKPLLGGKIFISTNGEAEKGFVVYSGSTEYLPVPDYTKMPFVYVTANGSSDFLVIDGHQYYQLITSPVEFAYYVDKTFKIDGRRRPTVEEIDKIRSGMIGKARSNPKIEIEGKTGEKITKCARGEKIVINASGFSQSKYVNIFINGKEFKSTYIAYENFGINLPIFSLKIGINKVFMIGDEPIEKAETTITITK